MHMHGKQHDLVNMKVIIQDEMLKENLPQTKE